MRKIIINCDGTSNGPDHICNKTNVRKPTNISKITRALKPISNTENSQVCYYDSIVETDTSWDNYIVDATSKRLQIIIKPTLTLYFSWREKNEKIVS